MRRVVMANPGNAKEKTTMCASTYVPIGQVGGESLAVGTLRHLLGDLWHMPSNIVNTQTEGGDHGMYLLPQNLQYCQMPDM
jgi:hypothetical protein